MARTTFPHPFGIELGAPLPPDFAIDAERSFEEWGNRPALADVFYFEPRHAIAGTVSRPNMTSFTVLTTLISGTAYGVESRGLEFAQRGSCRKTLAAHVRKLVGGRAVRVVRDWPVFLVAVNAPAGFSLDLTPTRWNRWRAFVPDIDSVLNVGGTHPDATAILAECRTEDLSGGPVERGEISVVHLPSLEVRIAEAFEADPFLKETFGQAVAVPANQRPAFMNPFGIPLGEPLALDAVAAKADPVTRGEWVANTQLAVTPPNPVRTVPVLRRQRFAGVEKGAFGRRHEAVQGHGRGTPFGPPDLLAEHEHDGQDPGRDFRSAAAAMEL